MPYACEVICDGDVVVSMECDGEAVVEISENGEFGVYQEASSRQGYGGPYNVKPSFEDQTLYTRDKLMLEDVTVDAISVSRVTNPAGGKTVYIGGIIDYGG